MVARAVEAAWRAGPMLVGDREVGRMVRVAFRELVSDEDLALLEEYADGAERSYRYPTGTPDRQQPTEWHEARKLQKLAQRISIVRGGAK